MAVQTAVPGLQPATGSSMDTKQAVILYSGLYLIAFGSGMVKPCVSTFGGDQFREHVPEEKPLISRFFSWFYISINIGSFVSLSSGSACYGLLRRGHIGFATQIF